MATRQLTERIKRGVAALDELKGIEWPRRINLTRLYLGSCTRCVLGQLFGEFETGVKALNKPDFDADELGFDRQYEGYQELTEAWQQEIEELRKERKLDR